MKKKKIGILSICIILAGCVFPVLAETTPQNNTVVSTSDVREWMPDENLQKKIASQMGIPVDQLTKESMKSLRNIDIKESSEPISNIKGLEYATEVTNLNIAEGNLISDFSPLEKMGKLAFVSITTPSLNDANFPQLADSVTYLSLQRTSITSKSLVKVANIKSLIYLQISETKGIESIEPLTKSEKLESLLMQFTSVSDFRPINEMKSLKKLMAYSQSVGNDSSESRVDKDLLQFDEENLKLTIPISLYPNRLTNFDGYQPPFTTKTDPYNMILKFNQDPVDGSRVVITDDSIVVDNVTSEDFKNLDRIYLNIRFNNPHGSYAVPNNFTDYAISSGQYTHSLSLYETPKYQTVTVRFVDEGNTEIAPQLKINGIIGKTYDASTSEYKINIPGYTLNVEKLPVNAKGTIASDPQTVTYVYTKEEIKNGKVVVKYVDTNNNEIAPEKTIEGNVGNSYDASTSEYTTEISGYILDDSKLPSNAKGTITSEPQTVTYVYTKEVIKNGKVIVEYVDTNNNEIAPQQTIEGIVGNPYDASTSEYVTEISGYTLDDSKLPSNAKGFITLDSQKVTYVFNKEEVKNGNVIIRYLDTNLQEIATRKVVNGIVGDSYNVSGADYINEIDGYTLNESKLPTNATGTFEESGTVVDYIYDKNSETPKPKVDPKDKSKDELPKTGVESTSKTLFALTTLMISAGVVMIYVSRKKYQ